ncbi:relaxase/mobilization nuclease domain-containing protein [Nitratireductor sp. XY-223]|uniref:relaxase/mobilization nuclease domain-containing protein n=1 Tax=Nitratireductor sp. XY-223 TaxID=2561926 RepID=UPI0010AA166C|nr:relaxase/mobilization nuclease domain-containing protein [Nitratireductor sp. XY-223]
MTVHVPQILLKDAVKKQRISPVDIVMGDPWAELNLGNPMRLSLLYAALNKQQGPSARGGPGSSGTRLRFPLSAFQGGNSAMVKVIKKGGTTNARGMRDQMSYLSKDGDAKLERSERYFGIELDETSQERLINSWGLSGETKTQSDKTTHIVVSFPIDTDHGAAYRAGRAWAEEMFASGKYGDVYDYYTAFHTDRAHPHIHVVINRRGMENGDWLKISRASAFNYDEFRAVQVEVAAREGIHLDTSPRYARGLSDRTIPDAEIRKAEREGRKPEAPSHTRVTAMRAAASIALYAGQYSTDAKLLREQFPELSKSLREMAATLLSGRELNSGLSNPTKTSLEEAKHASEFIMSRRSEILADIKEIDAEIASIPIGKERSMLERDASRIKAEAAQHLTDVADLIIHSRENPDGLYKGIEARDGIENTVKERADAQVAALAKSAGIDPERLVSRYDRSAAASIGLADSWRKDELEDIQKNLTYQPETPKSKVEELTQAAYDELHRNALQTYRKAERELEAHSNRKRELYRIAKLIRDGRRLDQAQEEGLRRTVKETLTSSELRELEAGHSKVFRHVAKDVDHQRALSRRYLEAELQDADGARKLQLNTALAKIDRDADLAAQRAAEQARNNKNRGLDL